jgi:pimeloyl-ACP methyl ester carboxylesterase
MKKQAYDLKEKSGEVVEMNNTLFQHSWIGGVRVENTFPQAGEKKAHPVIFVHGGCHGSWVFQNYLHFFAESGWESHALNWFNHNGSRSLPPEYFVVRGLTDIKEEIALVASTLSAPPIVIAHSMGGMAAQKFAEENDLRALVLLAPVVSIETEVDSIDLAVEHGQVWPVPPFDVARQLFFDGLDDEQAKHFYSLLCSESPKCVYEATRFTISVNYKSIHCPIFALGAEHDRLVPPDYVRALANLSGADFHVVPGRGHNLLLEPKWKETAGMIRDWLSENCL